MGDNHSRNQEVDSRRTHSHRILHIAMDQQEATRQALLQALQEKHFHRHKRDVCHNRTHMDGGNFVQGAVDCANMLVAPYNLLVRYTLSYA